jgi:hypothetical protein
MFPLQSKWRAIRGSKTAWPMCLIACGGNEYTYFYMLLRIHTIRKTFKEYG